MSQIMLFDLDLSRRKPENIVNTAGDCPFCHPETLTDIIERESCADPEGRFVFLRNKYNIMVDAEQFVLVESATCGASMATYSREHMRALLRFAFRQWTRLESCGKYSAVLFFKNHGYLSGGTMRHPHMQLIGVLPSARLDPGRLVPARESFGGTDLYAADGVSVNVTALPKIGYSEFNLIAPYDRVDTLADFVQHTATFVSRRFVKSRGSYNIFFYHLDEATIGVKLFARMPASPLFVGYDVAMVPLRFPAMVEGFRREFRELFS